MAKGRKSVRETKLIAAYVSGFIDAVRNSSPSHWQSRLPSVKGAYSEGLQSGKHHLDLAQQRATAYAAQICHVAPKEKSDA